MHDTFALRRLPGVRRAAAMTAAVLGLAAGALMAPATSPAAVCSSGEFCLYNGNRQTAGIYHHHGSDANLWNDRWENTAGVVANNNRSWWNRGTNSGPAQVRVFTGINGSGAFTCAPQGTLGDFRHGFLLNVESFEWRSFC